MHLFSFGDGRMSFFSRGYFVNIKGCKLLLALVKLKLKDKLAGNTDLAAGRSDPKGLRRAAQLLQSWGDLSLAEQALREGLYYAQFLDKRNIAAYLDEYADILRQLGRTSEAAEIDSRSIDRLKGLTHLKEKILQVL